MVAVGAVDLKQYLRHVRGHPEEYQRLAASFLIKVTEFFRDPDLYAYLAEKVLPALIAEAEREGGELRFWSAGCATGEEAYSLAIIAHEALGVRSDVKLRIFATDVDGEAIEFARRGVYAAPALERVPADLRRRYFSEVGGQYEVSPAIRGLIAFGQHDLASRAPFPRIDLAVCRNVLIYFTNDLQRRALQLFAFSLRDGGYLVLGKSETSTPLSDHFSLEEPRLKVYRRRGSRVLLPPSRSDVTMDVRPAPNVIPHRPRAVQEAGMSRAISEATRVRFQAARADHVIHRLPIGVVLVDRKYDIVLINTSARMMLGVHGTAVGQDLVHLARGVSSAELRRGIDSAYRGEPWRSAWDLPPTETPEPDVRSLEVTAYSHAEGGESELVILLLRDVSEEHADRRKLESALAEEEARSTALAEQLERMAEVTAALRDANEEFASVNVELRIQNEDLVVSNEEVQAATEEVETLNEEMQATNEELETLNEELQATVEELNTTNDDLEARSNELQALALSLEKQREVSEAERARLAAILGSMAEAVFVVDAERRLILTNDEYDGLAPLLDEATLDGDDGQPLDDESTPIARAARGESFSMGFSFIGADGTRQWFEAIGRPTPTDGKGGVVVIRDITDRSLQRIQSEFLATLSHELRTPLTGLSAYLEMLARRLSATDDAATRRYTDRAINQVRRFSSLVDELFDANRVSSGRLRYDMRPMELGPVVEEAVELARGLDEDREVTLDAGRAKLVVIGDPNRLQQVVFNLVANAIRHAPDSPKVEIRLRKRGSEAELSVRDWGPGIEPDEAGELFQRLEKPSTRSSDGLGLGLYIANGIVEGHGGTIRLESEPGNGATFHVRLPLHRDKPARG
jgi:two-component system CheB/CheR fusion protein